ncbi:MAG: hypothetical protein H7Y86_06745 [Rhizobacter sp.]|nr:hypothetical protein [Ferruginibacter sp.]
MIRVITLLIILAPFVLAAQTDTTGLIVTPHIATPIGKPNGESVSVKINKDGGSIKSRDGRVELIFPEGALSSKANISIQPITNHAAGGVGNAYDFEPSGTKFNKPVQIIFHYVKEELNGTLAELKSIATQSSNGKWYRLKNIVVDTTAQTLTSSIEHFSSYATFDRVKLRPEQANLKVGKAVSMSVVYMNLPDQDNKADENELQWSNEIAAESKWLVNGIPNGNATIGRITGKTNGKLFSAPQSVPDANPVAVTVNLNWVLNVNLKTFKKISLISNITIYDNAYQISVIGVWKDLRREKMGADYYRRGGGGVSEQIITDTSSFILHLDGNKSRITNIQNMFKDSIINRGNCTLTIWNEAIATGVIQIDGIESITVVPANPPKQQSRGITIRFKKPEIIMPDIVVECTGSSINNSMARGYMSTFTVGLPTTISFMEHEMKDYWSENAGIKEYQVIIRPLVDN